MLCAFLVDKKCFLFSVSFACTVTMAPPPAIQPHPHHGPAAWAANIPFPFLSGAAVVGRCDCTVH